MNENRHPSEGKFEDQVNPSPDLGGGGDSIQNTHAPKHPQDDLNANTSKPNTVEEPQMEENAVLVEDVQKQQVSKTDEADEADEDQKHEEKSDESNQDPSVSNLDNNTTEGLTSKEDSQEDDVDPELEEPRKLDRAQRENLYNKGSTMQEEGKSDKALKYFLASITGLSENNSYHDLPHCLHQISNIYFEQNEFEKAVHFIQAEKMYYETALIDIVNLQKQLTEERKQKDQEGTSSDNKDAQPSKKLSEDRLDPEITKAREFENLARLCLKEGKPQLALEYCGKATKIYRDELGDDHPVTVGSLDLFAIIYADVGKKLYEDAIQRFGEEGMTDTSMEASPSQTATSSTQSASQPSDDVQGQHSQTDGVRQRVKSGIVKKGLEDKKKPNAAHNRRVHFEEYEPAPPAADQDDWVGTVLLMILFVLITLLIGLIVSYFYCRDNSRSEMCAELKGDLTYWYMRIQYTYRYYTGSGRK